MDECLIKKYIEDLKDVIEIKTNFIGPNKHNPAYAYDVGELSALKYALALFEYLLKKDN